MKAVEPGYEVDIRPDERLASIFAGSIFLLYVLRRFALLRYMLVLVAAGFLLYRGLQRHGPESVSRVE